MPASIRAIELLRVDAGRRVPASDCAAVEEPLEIRLHGRPFSVTMRTPGADRELTAGFLLAERVVTSPDGIGTIEHCRDNAVGDLDRCDPDARGMRDNVVNVTLTDPADLERAFESQRHLTTSSACGVCGRRSIESLAADVSPLALEWTMSGETLTTLVDRLRDTQRVFDETGGLHAAGLFTSSGALVHAAEDVGRHNAVDKAIGRCILLDRWPLSDLLLVVSGRSSFEIVQKALLARIPIVASVSAPSSLAIDLARDMGITLAGFVRGDRFNIYTHAERIASSSR